MYVYTYTKAQAIILICDILSMRLNQLMYQLIKLTMHLYFD